MQWDLNKASGLPYWWADASTKPKTKRGPLPWAELVALHAGGTIDDETLVWAQSMDRWEPFMRAREVCAHEAAAPEAAAPEATGVLAPEDAEPKIAMPIAARLNESMAASVESAPGPTNVAAGRHPQSSQVRLTSSWHAGSEQRRLKIRSSIHWTEPRTLKESSAHVVHRRAHPAVRQVMKRYDKSGDLRLSEDEFGALLTKIRAHLIVLPPQQRLAGKWTKPPEESLEPERTERLLAAPFRVLRSRGADCQDSMSLSLFGKTSGDMLLGMCFQWASMMMQVSCGVVQGIGPYITQDTAAATAQILSIAGVKIGWALVLLCYRPCACGLTNAIIVCQFALEGISSVLLFLAAAWDDGSGDLVGTMRLISFLLLLFPVFLPVMQKFYDGVIVSIIVNCCRKKFSFWATFGAMLIFLLALPKFLGGLCGFSTGSFNIAKLSGSIKALVADARRLRKAQMQKATKRKVAKKQVLKEERTDNGDAHYAMAGAGVGIKLMVDGTMQRKRKGKKDESEDVEGDGDDAGDAGGDFGVEGDGDNGHGDFGLQPCERKKDGEGDTEGGGDDGGGDGD